jgi:hypothetical protein
MTTDTIASDSRAAALLQAAAQWRLIALLFEPPEGEWRGQIAGLAAEVDDPQLQQAAGAALGEATCTLYHSTLGPGGPAAAREVSYLRAILPGPMLSELAAFYEAFGYRPALAEPPDHVAVEVGFVAYLRLKEAYAVAQEQWEHAAMVSEAAGQFQQEHLAQLAEPLAASLAASGIDYLHRISAALLERVGPRPEPLTELPVVDDFECGAVQ